MSAATEHYRVDAGSHIICPLCDGRMMLCSQFGALSKWRCHECRAVSLFKYSLREWTVDADGDRAGWKGLPND